MAVPMSVPMVVPIALPMVVPMAVPMVVLMVVVVPMAVVVMCDYLHIIHMTDMRQRHTTVGHICGANLGTPAFGWCAT